ncbi:hypothetical protein SEA_SLIMJIMMY_145 [Mycobacterium phage SlimJimmy]|uniref:Uncharacterized protein n=3 Tax=Bongovirus bongo TaxID=1983750 RepID=A0A0M4QUH5_9CAUD|nr:hypothetical protein SEA_BRICOLE_150 [Mycobacterium phage Bricole]AXQ52767.1 hypothetical protein SEA_IPHANE7_145 [Mycobacterium phage IPhane7]QGJ93269.1 hypothetical protein SEA_TYDAWG_141 [Mycobacterium phage TyDawg]WMI33306.1 hypothetical protein SEA_SLIMJIMMY_145 [Mycobacterium phage SlimJimmy]WNM75338.1 hypothetical protein SEA_AUSPICE_148 [Mycobacterium phage Auspice]
MDPNEALALIRQAVKSGEENEESVEVGLLVDVIGGLDRWLSAGGFLPAAWAVNR